MLFSGKYFLKFKNPILDGLQKEGLFLRPSGRSVPSSCSRLLAPHSWRLQTRLSNTPQVNLSSVFLKYKFHLIYFRTLPGYGVGDTNLPLEKCPPLGPVQLQIRVLHELYTAANRAELPVVAIRHSCHLLQVI